MGGFRVAGPVLAMAGLLATAGFTGQPDDGCAEPGDPYPAVPWVQQLLAPERAWPFSRGSGATVAVLSTGVDAEHPQLAGRVAAGFDAVAGSGRADDDCLGTGTQVAGVIAASPASGVGFAGIAPAATILPVRVVASRDAAAEPDPAVLAAGIRWAAGNGAQVIDVAAAVYADDTDLRAAVEEALAAGVTVIAAAGTADPPAPAPTTPATPGTGETPYPAAYPGVIGVGAIDAQGSRWAGSPAGEYVDLMAPGAGMVSAQRGGGMAVDLSGTEIASGVVAGAAALVHARGAEESDIAHRLLATATPGASGPGFGHGVVNPYTAVTDALPARASPAPLPGLDWPAGEPETGWSQARMVAAAGTAVAALLLVAVIVVRYAAPRGRRRRWRAAVAPPPLAPEPLGPSPPVPLFGERY